jgi:uncharacterized protein
MNDTKTVTTGRFYWHELCTRDAQRAKGFYGELFGWTSKPMDMGPFGTYFVLSVGEKQVGGIATVESAGEVGWLSYVTVADVDEAADRAKKLGAKLLTPPSDIPGVGRFALLLDREGARIAPFRPANESVDAANPPSLGEFCWSELLSQDVKVATEFHTKLFAWGTDERDMGPLGKYTMFKRGDRQAAGCMKAMDPRAAAQWLDYVVVDDVDSSYARAAKLGAKQLVGPMDLPGIGRSAVVADPEGSMIALFKGQSA